VESGGKRERERVERERGAGECGREMEDYSKCGGERSRCRREREGGGCQIIKKL
jgi:hypothetical protein